MSRVHKGIFFTGIVLIVILCSPVEMATPQAQPQRLSRLYLNTACQLPCWLGIKPGLTPTHEAEQELLRFYGQTTDERIQPDPGDNTYYSP